MAAGRSTIDGVPALEMQENWRLGGTLVFPVSRHNSLKLAGTTGLYARTGGNFHVLAASLGVRLGRPEGAPQQPRTRRRPRHHHLHPMTHHR